MTEKTEIGFKFILLEGKITIIGGKKSTEVEAGNLILINDQEGNISQTLKIELPLLLGTSQIIELLSETLPSFPNNKKARLNSFSGRKKMSSQAYAKSTIRSLAGRKKTRAVADLLHYYFRYFRNLISHTVRDYLAVPNL